jgi:uncharacterized repeat protein (TIGR03803 family)
MGSKQFWYSVSKAFAVGAVTLMLAHSAGAANKEKVLYSFTGGNDGGDPAAALAFDKAGNLYGTTVFGGTGAACTGAHAGCGTVFKLTRNSNGRWQQTVIYNFQGIPDGKNPYGGVIVDSKGNLYGTTVAGGSGGTCANGDGCGTVYRLTRSGNSWTETVLYSFTGGTDGAGPGSGVAFDTKGNIYGTTPDGGKPNGCAGQGCGVVYQLVSTKGGGWKENVIHTFTGGNDGATGSLGSLLVDKKGNVFGIAELGGAHGAGTAFKLSPTSGGKYKLSTLDGFAGTPHAGFPYGGLISDAAGNLYGTTYFGGANGLGSVFKLTLGSNGKYTESVLYSFKTGTDGNSPTSTLVFDAHGNLYGTTSAGGDANGDGIVFKLTPSSGGKWKESVAHRFSNHPDGSQPYYGLVLDKAGNLYGTTAVGGVGAGVVFELTP